MSVTLLADELPKARKPHRCCWCGQQINAGEVYRRQRTIFDGALQSNAWHPECFDAAEYCDLEDGFTLYEGERPVPERGSE